MRTASSVLVLLHGRWYRSGSMHDLTDRLGLPGTECVAPAAAERTWYPGRFMEPRAANEPALSDAIARVHEVLDELEAEGVEPERIVLGGFSQGGCVACDALAQRPRPVAALVVLNGGLIGADEGELTRPAAGTLEGLPVLLTGAVDDEWIPLPRVRRTAEVLEAAGAQVDLRIHPAGEHEIREEEVDALRQLVERVGPS